MVVGLEIPTHLEKHLSITSPTSPLSPLLFPSSLSVPISSSDHFLYRNIRGRFRFGLLYGPRASSLSTSRSRRNHHNGLVITKIITTLPPELDGFRHSYESQTHTENITYTRFKETLLVAEATIMERMMNLWPRKDLSEKETS
jgi:hypothetical protein